MLSRILQSINTNVRELRGRQQSPLSPISAKAVSADEKDHDPGVPLVQESKSTEILAVAGDNKSRQLLFCGGDLPVPAKQRAVTTYCEKGAVHLEKTVELCLKANSLNDPLTRSSSKLSRTVHLAKHKSTVLHVGVRQIDRKRKLSNQPALDTRKKHRKDIETQVTDNIISIGNGNTKSRQSRRRWCRRCGTIETCRWRTSPAGSQTACNACYLMVKGKSLPDTEFENFLIYPLETLKISVQSGEHIKKSQKANMQNTKQLYAKNANKTSSASLYEKTAVINNNKKLTVEATAMQCANIQCRTKITLVWRRGPDGVKCLCNRCGLRWANDRLPKDQIVPVNFIPDKTCAHLSLKELSVSSLSQAERPNPYVKIRSNIFVERKHTRHNRKSPVCQCTIPVDGSLGCSEDCLNRMMFYECDVQTCPCGKLCSNQRFQHKEEVNDLNVFWTNRRGWGLQTLTDIKVGQLIAEYRGEIISQKLCEERLRTVYKDTNNFYFLDYQNGEVIDAAAKGSDARFVNHSCDPNCHIEKWAIGGEVCVGIFASQDISAGSELFYDYNYTLIGSGVSQKCRCESTKCRGYMGRKASVREHSSK
ncbi:hypothetical protein K450DRAFT_249280 [Umbelopsis ramanniana AG]|uniref:Uncharacterized protein n=1 Tax=Umbelopsis ramanniana AG TaxID=1314678 RepID=A0AAD5E6U8_UMBRA|nr:uncharacterized protein K450DRAFT_249280 [Umbelopsis ramanniana AG]KAI8577972.1 hypothetical protein K450DRAFT_249280 [Umbelopsis ramanniana AG]